ncbi:MAG TPA: response regulator [Gammaproteobacteria bacterium]|nr:response regulator [Gammaproteobacteria bacterium]
MNDTTPGLLVVDDDEVVREMLRDYFSRQGFEVRLAGSAAEARSMLDAGTPQLVFLDVGLPGEDGLSLARHIREKLDIPIVMISGAGEALDRIIGLEVGADDYVTKPFDPRELLARVKSIMRRYQRAPEALEERPAERVRIPGFELDLASRRLFRADGEELILTRMEFDLLQVFVEHPNRVLSRDQILNMTQNRDWDPFDRSIDIRVARLRRKLEDSPDSPVLIRTVRGVGYMFVPDAA